MDIGNLIKIHLKKFRPKLPEKQESETNFPTQKMKDDFTKFSKKLDLASVETSVRQIAFKTPQPSLNLSDKLQKKLACSKGVKTNSNNLSTKLMNLLAEECIKEHDTSKTSLSLSYINKIEDKKNNLHLHRSQEMPNEIIDQKSRIVGRTLINAFNKRSIGKNKELNIFAKGLRKMILKTFQTNKVSGGNLKEILSNPEESIKRFAEERKETKMQKKLLQQLLNDCDIIAEEKNQRKQNKLKDSDLTPKNEPLKIELKNSTKKTRNIKEKN